MLPVSAGLHAQIILPALCVVDYRQAITTKFRLLDTLARKNLLLKTIKATESLGRKSSSSSPSYETAQELTPEKTSPRRVRKEKGRSYHVCF